MRVVSFLGCVCLMLLVAISLGSSASIYPGTVTEVECGGSYVNPGGISNDPTGEEIVGQWSIKATSHAFMAQVPATPTTAPITQCSIIDPPKATFARALGISSQGNLITGFYAIGLGNARQFYAFIRNASGGFSSFNINSMRTVPNGINMVGVLVGSLGNEAHGFAATTSVNSGVYSVANWVSFDFPGASNTVASAINDSYSPSGNSFTGKTLFVGYFNPGSHGFWGYLTISGTSITGVSPLTQFDCSGASATRALGINNAGMMVGATDINGTTMGFITTFDPSAGAFSTNCATYLIPSNSKGSEFYGVNNNTNGAQIFGGFSGSFVLTPQ